MKKFEGKCELFSINFLFPDHVFFYLKVLLFVEVCFFQEKKFKLHYNFDEKGMVFLRATSAQKLNETKQILSLSHSHLFMFP